MSRFQDLIPNDSELVYRTFGDGEDRLGSGFMHKPGTHPHRMNYQNWDPPTWSLVYVLRGKGSYALEGGGPTIPLAAGNCFQRRPGVPHSTTVDDHSGWAEVFIDLGPGLYRSLDQVPFFFPDRHVWTIGERPTLARSILSFHHELKAAGEADLPPLFCRCMDLIRTLVEAAKEPDPDRDLLEAACRFLGENFSEKRSLQGFCRVHGVGYERLRKLFSMRMGLAPHRYRIRRRMDRASQLLLDTSWSIGTIAEDLGYASPYEFSAQFRREFNDTPSTFRRSGFRMKR